MEEIVQFPEIRVNAGKEFRDAVLLGLSQQQKSVPSRFFYDQRGSELFERITELP